MTTISIKYIITFNVISETGDILRVAFSKANMYKVYNNLYKIVSNCIAYSSYERCKSTPL